MPEIGDRVRVEGFITHAERHFVEVRLETGGFLRIARGAVSQAEEMPTMSIESARLDLIRDLREAVETLRAESTRLRGAMTEVVCLANEALAAGTLSDSERLARQIRDTAAGALAPRQPEEGDPS